MTYEEFIKHKVASIPDQGFAITADDINPILKPHQAAMVRWMVSGGRRACFAAFGLGKTIIQLETVRIVRQHAGGMGLIVIPLGVRQEFFRDDAMLGIKVKFIRRIEEADNPEGIYLTNYETVRDGKINPRLFTIASLDEASVLRGFGGTKTFREFMRLFTTDAGPNGNRRQGVEVPYRFVATATPSPNEYIELLCYAAFLGILDVSQAKTRFFKRDSTKADKLTLLPHKEQEFWLWVASWALFVQKPSDLGFSDEGYILPELDIRWHEIQVHTKEYAFDRDGQGRLVRNAALGVQDASREKRISLQARADKLMEIRAEDPAAHRLIWHDLEAERHEIEKAIPSAVSIYGAQDLDEREQSIIDFSDGKIRELAAKPVIAGSGCNFQRFCHWAIYLGIGFKFNDFIQSIHRIQRFLQTKRVRIDLIYTDAETEIRKQLERKWAQHKEMVQKMTEIIREYGLSQAAMTQSLKRALGVERVEITGDHYKVVNNDAVIETRNMESNSVGLILTSIPFSTQYEYSPNYCDFGHTDNNQHFFDQMGYLTPELLRVLQPGRIAAIHVKDRITPGGVNGLGFQTVYEFHCDVIKHFKKHGFGYMGMKTIVTDVVRENNQTYRLGWTEQCKDGSKMGVGMPEYLLIFRKPPTDTTDSYADTPVVKEKPLCVTESGEIVPFARDLPIKPGTGYSRSRWQIDAHGFTRSSGNRLLSPEDLRGLPHDQIFRLFRDYSLNRVYDFEHHVRIGEHLEKMNMLPVTFMLLQPQSWHPDVWTDITRMLCLNSSQAAQGKVMHLCPLQFDIADRAITQWSMPNEIVYDPFGGIMTVPYRAILLGRYGMGCELSPTYFLDGATYCKAAEDKIAMPDLFATLEEVA